MLYSCADLEFLNNFVFHSCFQLRLLSQTALNPSGLRITLPIPELGGFAGFSKADPADLEKV